ncbi:YbhB/YbcL family Raf kinase inhibitor-like protein [Ensifer sp. ENS11]|uniref:YbhB/YbcL family Raf kinase inhibitor-like protein n=1 Tax=Ensifer sp. ENS11 TaxID=2769291 RepID=UPI0017800657|nr:hypothetical protein [Ensifer sp. ENS11]
MNWGADQACQIRIVWDQCFPQLSTSGSRKPRPQFSPWSEANEVPRARLRVPAHSLPHPNLRVAHPPKGHGVHRYNFRRAALDVARLAVPEGAGVETMWRAAREHTLSEACRTATYEVS